AHGPEHRRHDGRGGTRRALSVFNAGHPREPRPDARRPDGAAARPPPGDRALLRLRPPPPAPAAEPLADLPLAAAVGRLVVAPAGEALRKVILVDDGNRIIVRVPIIGAIAEALHERSRRAAEVARDGQGDAHPLALRGAEIR